MKVETENILKFMNDAGCTRFVISSMIPLIDIDLNYDKKTVLSSFRELKELGLIKRHFEYGGCKTVCASFYEYGCDAEQKPPISYWILNN